MSKMNYKLLFQADMEKLFDTDMSVGEIIRALTLEKFTGLKCENRNVLTEMTDQQWSRVAEKAYENETETEYYGEHDGQQ